MASELYGRSFMRDIFFLDSPTKDRIAKSIAFSNLIARYDDPSRHYHTLEHLSRGLKVYYQLFNKALPPLEFFAWLYHDAVYETTRSDNEAQSAAVFMHDAPTLGFSMDDVDQITRFILATDPSVEPISVLNDIDLAELGAAPDVFDRNTDNIRKEYDWVSEEVWRKGRIAVLTQLLKREKLYITQPFSDKFLQQAQENLKREIAELSKT